MKKTLTIFGGSGFLGKSFYDCFLNKKLEKFDIGTLNLVSRTAEQKFKSNKNPNIKCYNFDFAGNSKTLSIQTDYIISRIMRANFYDKELLMIKL